MKMSWFEKLFVNSHSHSRSVSDHAAALLNRIDFVPGQKYLDMGCGNGAAPIRIARQYPLDVTGIDVDPAQIQVAESASRDLDNVHFAKINGVELPFEAGEFDIVATNKVMHHIPQWEIAFAKMVRVLKPGGHLLYSDLIYAPWLAALGKALVKTQAGFPTLSAIEALVAHYRLQKIHCSRSSAQYEAIFQKPR